MLPLDRLVHPSSSPLERVLGIFAVAQTIIATLRASSNIYSMIQDGTTLGGVVEGPLIEPPSGASNKSSDLWVLSHAFQHSVMLALDRDDYGDIVEYEINDLILQESARLSPPSKLSPDYEGVDEEIELMLQNVDRFGERHFARGKRRATTRTSEGGQVVRKQLVGGMIDTVSIPANISALGKSVHLPLLRRLHSCTGTRAETGQEQDSLDPLESDFYLTLSTVKLMQNNVVSPTKSRVAQLVAYAPEGFAQLRSMFGIDERDFRRSILESGPYVSFSSNSKGAARAGGVFFFTRDGAYLIKTIKQDEVPALLQMLPRYFRFMKRNAKQSLLTRFCGMYEVTFRDDSNGKPYTFVVMNSVFPARAASSLSERFDLKGSTIGRECSAEDRETKGGRAVLLDKDLARETDLIKSLQEQGRYSKLHGYGFDVGSKAKVALMSQLRRDVDFLVSCNVMDYSLLVGVERLLPGGLAASDLQLVGRAREGEFRLQLMRNPNATATSAAVAVVASQVIPPLVRALAAPLAFAMKLLSLPLFSPTHDRVVDAGPLTRISGRRLGTPALYYIGLIDFLQPFNAKKALEYRLKSALYKKESFSCVPPQQYGERFLAFINDHIV